MAATADKLTQRRTAKEKAQLASPPARETEDDKLAKQHAAEVSRCSRYTRQLRR
jgi:hypothetical protein